MTDRRQIALKMWEDHKHWTGEKNVRTGWRKRRCGYCSYRCKGAAELHHVELYQTLEECTADMWEIAPRLEKNEAMLCMEANI
jgi:hypothetical protein